MPMCSMVLSHLDYGKATLVNVPKSALKFLQSIQNYTAKVTYKHRYMITLRFPIFCLYKPLFIKYCKKMYHNTWPINSTSKQQKEQPEITNQTPDDYRYHSTRKRHKCINDLASQDPNIDKKPT